jgi:hypothetical protein
MNSLHSDDPDREMSEYADAAQSTAFALFRKLAKQGPPKIPKHDEPISLGQLVEEVEPVEKYYNDLIVFDPERNAIIIPFGSMPEIDLDEIKEAKDLLLCVLAFWAVPHLAGRMRAGIAHLTSSAWQTESPVLRAGIGSGITNSVPDQNRYFGAPWKTIAGDGPTRSSCVIPLYVCRRNRGWRFSGGA